MQQNDRVKIFVITQKTQKNGAMANVQKQNSAKKGTLFNLWNINQMPKM